MSIGTVIVKDMSRIGRDYLQVGFYTDQFFNIFRCFCAAFFMSFYDIGAAASQQVLGASDLLRMAFLWQGSGKNRYFLWSLWCFEISSSYPLGTTGLSEPEKGLWISWSIGGVAMSRNIRVSEPSAEMQIKIIRAKDAIASQLSLIHIYFILYSGSSYICA